MDSIRSGADDPINRMGHVAIYVETVGADQRHAGHFHRAKPNELRRLHLAWHCMLEEDSATPEDTGHVVWVEPFIDQDRALQVAALCRKIIRKNGKNGIPYAFTSPNDCFDAATGTFLLGPTRLGLTCATFVLAVFQAAGIKLVDHANWPERPEDETWRAQIVEALRGRAGAEHIDAMGKTRAPRVRPEEVAGGAVANVLPADFETASAHAALVLQKLAVVDGPSGS